MLEIFLIVLAVSIDSFITSFSYGISKIKIPMVPALLISGIGSCLLGISMFFAGFISNFIPPYAGKITSALLLFIIGTVSVFSELIKRILRKNKGKKQLNFNCSGIDFVISLYLDETTADIDGSKSLSVKEAFFLAIALSADNLVTGFSAGLASDNKVLTIAFAFILGLAAICLGSLSGRLFCNGKKCDMSYISGIVLILLAVLRFF